ncbi:hypothetical protein [Flavobacterium sp.]|uniref:hypothetical protein n=1 Tax=Flavobacterium sp. TaxID=239 RepID=UPI002489D985|nr:hypothetical protein [Flavobacterium sp.]MDI1316115.1 hypothetical protein [Flavobacterium sp.]
MITTINLILSNQSKNLELKVFDKKIVTSLAKYHSINNNSFDIEITFIDDIEFFRTHDYQWAKSDKELVASEYTPKIVKLKNGFYIQPTIQVGIWEFNPKYKNKILWRINPEFSATITKYSGPKNEKKVESVFYPFDFNNEIALVFSNKNAIEFSRSPIPFSAIACFTDHCDFDTLDNLKSQRAFFKENEIKITKGFFLNHYSKREDNASFENNFDELLKWKNDGHELCYHSLSQSLKNDKESFEDFVSFENPINSIPTWIDHGYQPYNFSLYENLGFEESEFVKVLNKNKIEILWNYIDSGTSTLGVLNQLNSNDFTLKSYFKGIKNLSFKDKFALKIKIILFHYYADQETITKYKNVSSSFKKCVEQKKIRQLFHFVQTLISISIPIVKVFFYWNSIKNKPFKFAKYAPVVFKHKIQNFKFTIFQTIEIVDFKKSLSFKNIDKLAEEKGLFIAHTYFSVPMKYHFGKLFKSENIVDQEVADNFSYLSSKIKSNQIWNPTISELVQFLSKFEDIKLDVNESGNIICSTNFDLPYRDIN